MDVDETPTCFLAQFATTPCDGHLIRAHLLPRQLLRRELPLEQATDAIDDPRSWVPACGGLMGNAGHHGAFDTARTIRVPHAALPAGTMSLAEELGLLWYIDRTYPMETTAP